MTAVALTGVRKAYATPAGPRPVLDGVDLAVGAGEIVVIAGRSGSGKTTLLAIMAGWAGADAGVVEFDRGEPEAAQRSWPELAILPQSLALLDELTIVENVTLPLRLAPAVAGDDPDELMDKLGIAHLADRYPDEVSLGEQQRVALARAAVVQPQVLVADEPISHQNQTWAERMMLVFWRLADRGTACVLATHNEIAFESADRVLELRDGRLEQRTTSRSGS